MKGPLPVVLVHLAHGDVGNHAGNRDVDLRVLQRQSIDRRIAALNEEERREGFVSARSLALSCGTRRHEQNSDGTDGSKSD